MKSEVGPADVSLGYATFPDRATAERLCTQLVAEKIVACANILAPHTAIYAWDGEVQSSTEVGAILKFASTHRETLAQRFRDLHPYAVPALVWFDVTGGSPTFLQWIHGSPDEK